MENKEYNRLIYNNKLNELSEIWNISDLTRYDYLNKYLLEYLLEKDIHTTRMDNHASKDELWIKLYIKYGITKPLLNTELDKLLVMNDNELLLETLLKKLSKKDKLELYNNFKNNSFWLLRKYETLIINLYKKYNIMLDNNFIKMPTISDKLILVSPRLNIVLSEFATVFNDIDKNVLSVYINEFKRKSKVDEDRTILDINKLIDYKKSHTGFKLTLKDFIKEDGVTSGEYDSSNNRIVINKYTHDTFNHELSHLFYDELENPTDTLNVIYKTIQDKIVTQKTINKIVNYLKEFHSRYDYMENIFRELYYTEINKNFGSFNNYCHKIYDNLLNSKPDIITMDNHDTTIFLDYDQLEDTVIELVTDECNFYVKNLVHNYYSEELMLENLLDALLKGNIFANKYGIDSLSGHSKKSFREDKNLSFNECLADFDAIKNSTKANILINKLRSIVGDELVDYLEEYINNFRNSKQKIKK